MTYEPLTASRTMPLNRSAKASLAPNQLNTKDRAARNGSRPQPKRNSRIVIRYSPVAAGRGPSAAHLECGRTPRHNFSGSSARTDVVVAHLLKCFEHGSTKASQLIAGVPVP